LADPNWRKAGGHGFRTETLRIRPRICEWGLKNYAYRVIANHSEKTVKSGVSLNYHASKLVNFEVIRAIILEEGEPIVNVHTERKLKRKRKAGGR